MISKIFKFTIYLIIISYQSQTFSDEIDNKIKLLESCIDSINFILSKYEKNKDYDVYVLDEIRIMEDELEYKQHSLEKLKQEKRDALIVNQEMPIFGFRDVVLESTYFVGYNNPADPIYKDLISIKPRNGIACNNDIGKITYGFANMHCRENELIIDFEKFSRIGIYSLFPETYGSIEMIFSTNVGIDVHKINQKLISQAHKYNTKVDFVLSYYSWEANNNLKPKLNFPAVMTNIIDSIFSILESYDFDGVTFDFDISKMNYKEIMHYKEIVLRLHNAIKQSTKKTNINIVVSAQDILDTVLVLPRDTVNRYTKLELFLKPDQFDYIDLLLVNLDFTYLTKGKEDRYKAISPLKGIQDNKDIVGLAKLFRMIDEKELNLQKIVGVLPLYGHCWIKKDSLSENTITQAIFPKDLKFSNYKYDFLKVEEDDALMFFDDLSVDGLREKIAVILKKLAGIGIWHIEYGDSSFYDVLYKENRNYTKNMPLRLFMLDHFYFLPAFIGPNRCLLGFVLIFIVVMYFSIISILKFIGREKMLAKYKLVTVIIGVLLALLISIYLICIPSCISQTLENIFLLLIFFIVLAVIVYQMIKINKMQNLP